MLGNQDLTDSIKQLKDSLDMLKNDGDWGIKGLTIKMNSISTDFTELSRDLKELCKVLWAIERKLK